jgi:hypothetical protein
MAPIACPHCGANAHLVRRELSRGVKGRASHFSVRSLRKGDRDFGEGLDSLIACGLFDSTLRTMAFGCNFNFAHYLGTFFACWVNELALASNKLTRGLLLPYRIQIQKGRNFMVTATATETRETANLIGSDKVEGTAVYGTDRNNIGSIERVMIDKLSGKVAYAVMSFGGFMGMGEDYYPVPWSTLKYDTNLGGYRTNLTETQLKGAPKYSKSTDWNWNRDNDRRVYDYYRAQPYWD